MSKSKNKTNFDWNIFIILVVAVVCIQVAYYFFMQYQISELAEQGQFGDMFGALTALFSGFAFAGMITAIVLQTKELGYQRKELKLTRDEISAQKEIFKTQNFNNSFYRLLGYYKSNLDQIVVTDKETSSIKKGIDALSFSLSKFSKSQTKYNKYISKKDENKMKVYEFHLCLDIRSILLKQARYINTFESLLFLVDSNLKTEAEKEVYWKIIDSQLTAYEIQYIFYQSLVNIDGEFSRLINKSFILQRNMQSIGLKRSVKAVYERLHGVKISLNIHKNKLPHSREQITKLKKQIFLNEKN